jgi:hypothetical protein
MIPLHSSITRNKMLQAEEEDSDSENEFNKVEFFQPSIFNKYQNN